MVPVAGVMKLLGILSYDSIGGVMLVERNKLPGRGASIHRVNRPGLDVHANVVGRVSRFFLSSPVAQLGRGSRP